jgi:hypothetical protein
MLYFDVFVMKFEEFKGCCRERCVNEVSMEL